MPSTFEDDYPTGGAPTTIFQGSPYSNPFDLTFEPSAGDIIVAASGATIFRQNPVGPQVDDSYGLS